MLDFTFNHTVVTSGGFDMNPRTVGAPVAPMGVTFSVDNLTGLGTTDLEEVEVFFDYGDDYDFRYVTPSRVNDAKAGDSRGHLGGHVFRTPGTYTVGCLVYNPAGIAASQTVEIVVPSADDFYAGTLTKCVSADGDWTGAPEGSELVDWSGGAVIDGLVEPGHRILFKAGMDIRIPSPMSPIFYQNDPIQIGRFGTGANPILRPTGDMTMLSIQSRAGKLTLYEVDFVGDYDPTAENDWFNEPEPPVAPGAGIVLGLANIDGENNSFCCFGARVVKLGINMYFGGPYPKLVVDTDISEWWNFGFFGGATFGGSIGFVGVKGVQPSNSILGPIRVQGTQTTWNLEGYANNGMHGPARFEDASDCLVNKSELQSITGWSGANTPNSRAAPNSALRLGTNWQPEGEENICVTQSDLRYGFGVVETVTTSGNGPQGKPKAVIIDSCRIVANERTNTIFRLGKPGQVVRNCLIEYPAGAAHLEGASANGPTSFALTAGDYAEGLGDFPVKFQNNTVKIDNDVPGIWATITTAAGATIQYTNNITQMNGAFTLAGSSAFFTATQDWTPLDAQLRPQSGSPAFQTATGGVPVFDLDGIQRGGSPSKGALEPA